VPLPNGICSVRVLFSPIRTTVLSAFKGGHPRIGRELFTGVTTACGMPKGGGGDALPFPCKVIGCFRHKTENGRHKGNTGRRCSALYHHHHHHYYGRLPPAAFATLF
jgi:hypothetical protein